jgi:PAS domain S-box-containing protein
MPDAAFTPDGSPDGWPPDSGWSFAEAEAILKQLAGELIALPNDHRTPALSTQDRPTEQRAGSDAGGPWLAATGDGDKPAGGVVPDGALGGLVEAIPDALVIVDHRGQIVVVNSQTERLFGYRRDELLGRPIELLVPERFRDRHVADRNAFMAAPRVRPMGQGLDLFGRRKDGRDIPVEISLSPLATADGVLVVATIRDASERRRAEAQLRKMEARYRTLVEGIPAVTFMAALDEGVNELYVSPQIEELLGFTQKEWLEDPVLWYQQLHPDDRVRWHEEFARTCVSAEPFRSVYRFVARDGRLVWVHGEAQVVRDGDGRPLFLQGVAFDITGIKKAEEELMAVNQTLERRVAERTRELARSNEALEQFSYVVAHDLRQPLRTMKSFIQKLAERYHGQLDSQADDYITRGINAADRMRILIDDLLAYSRVRTQGKEPTLTECGEAVASACANLQAAIDENGAIVTSGELPTVLFDPTQLVQLFQNLIGNALKFRSDDPPRIRISARRQRDEWVISAADNGIGIEAQYLQRIFGLGERLHGVAKYPGNGIGLATCEMIVQRHGGRIWAESAGLGKGCTISFTVPANHSTGRP